MWLYDIIDKQPGAVVASPRKVERMNFPFTELFAFLTTLATLYFGWLKYKHDSKKK